MNDYTIVTDSGCDIPLSRLTEWGVRCAELVYRFEDAASAEGTESLASFYQKMREGKLAKTSAVNVEAYRVLFEEEFRQGKDVLYLGFSSGLSNTVHAAAIAANELKESYPQRSAVVLDTLSASAGQGFLVFLAVQKKQEAATLAETAQYIQKSLPNLAHWFTVDDLTYLRRGGRISGSAAFAAAILGIKPILHMDEEGHLTNVRKVRGRKNAIQALAEQYAALAKDPQNGIYLISHGDCAEDAQRLDTLLYEQYGRHAELCVEIQPAIGAHSGPGTLALFFVGKQR